jgi:DNA-binding CsgD family transcriptional regulator
MANETTVSGSGSVEAGLLLLDLSLRAIAWDQGAASILQDGEPSSINPQSTSWIPKEILEMIRRRKHGDLAALKTYFHIGETEYLCRAYLLESISPSTMQPVVAVYLERSSFAVETVYECASEFHLTVREAEVLRGIAMGLATKELATRLNISPNTVKAFLRLVMIKMGVATRGELFARILESRGTVGGRRDRFGADGKDSGRANRAADSTS